MVTPILIYHISAILSRVFRSFGENDLTKQSLSAKLEETRLKW